MIMTRETDYAVRILRALSCGERLTVRQVCDSELVPVQFAYKILKKLASCGYVEIFRGQEGGCRLSDKTAAGAFGKRRNFGCGAVSSRLLLVLRPAVSGTL